MTFSRGVRKLPRLHYLTSNDKSIDTDQLMLMNRRAAAVDQCPSARTEEPQMSDMPLILVAVMFDKNNKAMGGFDVWTVTTAEHFDTAKEMTSLIAT